MTYNVWIFFSRKAGTTPAAFRSQYETIHIPLIKSFTGPSFPQSHTSHYIARTEPDSDTPMVLVGTPEDFTYDLIVELVFADEAASKHFFGIVSQGEANVKICENEDKFLDRAKTRAMVVDQVHKTVA